MKFNMIKNIVLVLFLTLYIAGCSSDSSSPEDLGSLMFTSIKSANLHGFKACYAGKDDFLYLFEQSNNGMSREQAERQITRRISENEAKSTFTKIRMKGIRKGIVWEEAVFQKVVRSRDTIVDEIAITTVNAFFMHDGSTYKIVLKNCVNTNDGWHIFTFDPKLVVVDQEINKTEAPDKQKGIVNRESIKE